MENKLLVNAWKTPDGTVLESRHRHDYVYYTDSVTGEDIFVDGGIDYIRVGTSGSPDSLYFVGCYTSDPQEEIREKFSWGSYGIDGKQPKHYIFLKDMTTQHIRAILETQHHIKGTVVEQVFKNELEYRNGNR